LPKPLIDRFPEKDRTKIIGLIQTIWRADLAPGLGGG